MEKNIFIIQNTEIGSNLALSIFLTSLLNTYQKEEIGTLNLICSKREKNESIEKIEQNFNIFYTKTSLYTVKDNILFSIKTVNILLKNNRKKKIDILHAFYPNSSLLACLVFKILTFSKTKIIYDIRSPWIEMSFANNHISHKRNTLKRLMHLSEKILILFVDYFIFVTEGTRDYYKAKYHIHTKKSKIIPSGVDVKKFRQKVTKKEKEKILQKNNIFTGQIVIGYVGSLGKLRKIDSFIQKNAKEIQSQKIKLLLIGAGDGEKKIKETIQKYKLEKNIKMLGLMNQENVIKHLSVCDYGLNYSEPNIAHDFNCPLKVLEYLATGIKVITSKNQAGEELKKVFSSKVKLIDNGEVGNLNKEANEVPSKHIRNYSWSTLKEKYKRIYEKI